MVADTKYKNIQEFLEKLTDEELVWASGYVTGRIAAKPAQSHTAVSNRKVTIVYGTESGNSKKLASGFAMQSKQAGVQAKLASLDQYRITDLTKEENLLVVISTQGDGEPPASAKKFYDFLHENTPSLQQLNFGVLALGDTAYPLFCKAGEDVDARLEFAGGKRIIPVQKCDTDFEAVSQAWFVSVLSILAEGTAYGRQLPSPPLKTTGKKLFNGKVISNVNLSGRGSGKETHHVEITAEELSYEPGDSIGVVPYNSLQMVENILSLCDRDANRKMTFRGEEYTTRTLLEKKPNIYYLPERVVQKYAALVGQEIPPMRIDLFNLLKIYPMKDASQFEDVIALLEPITPRLYSIASSPSAHEGEIHLTVARDRFTVNGEVQYGLCSDYFAHLPENGELEFYIHKNSQFRLPPADQDIIMIGPGTGIAPFRSFLAERDATGAAGRNWLFFGDQKFASDFLYQTEIQDYASSGLLSKVSLAFSRDQAKKIYVQHRMVEEGEELFQWLEDGAAVYLCGAKDPMADDVENTLTDIISICGKKTLEEAKQYLDRLKETNRYHKDVY